MSKAPANRNGALVVSALILFTIIIAVFNGQITTRAQQQTPPQQFSPALQQTPLQQV